jgi:hypothetical protein
VVEGFCHPILASATSVADGGPTGEDARRSIEAKNILKSKTPWDDNVSGVVSH